MAVYATIDDLTARLSDTYSVPANAEQLLAKASELVDEHVLGARAENLFASTDEEDAEAQTFLSNAVCDQVEFWIEVGEEHDVSGLKGSMVAGRVQVHPVPLALGQRALRSLRLAGLTYLGVNAR